MPNEVATAAEQVPDYLIEKEDLGVDEMDSSDVPTPRLKICQPSSTKIKSEMDIKEGDFYISSFRENLGTEIEFFVLLWWKSEVWFSEDRKLLAVQYKDNITKQIITFGNNQKVIQTDPKAGQQAHNYFLILKKDLDEGVLTLPLVWSAMSARIQYAKQMNGKFQLNASRSIPIYCQLIKAATKLESFKGGDAYMPNFSFPDFCTAEQKERLKILRKQCVELQSSKGGNIHEEEPSGVEGGLEGDNGMPTDEGIPNFEDVKT